jgi:glycosyltransferase involved in cell wall biosynthesis
VRIWHVITLSELGGAQSVVVELANGQVCAGHDVSVGAGGQGEMWDSLDRRVRRVPLPHLKRELAPLDDFFAFCEIKRAARFVKPDIVNLHVSKAGLLGRLALIRYRKRIVFTVHGFDTILYANRKFLFLEKIMERLCGRLVAVSEYDEKHLRASGISNCQTIYNGISLRKGGNFHAEDRVANVLRKARRAGNKLVLSVARISKQKRFDLFCEVAKRYAGEKVTFAWIGNKEDIPGVPDNVLLLGQVMNAADYLVLADVFVLFSYYEGLPMSILEAMSKALPIVASSVGGVTELLGHGCGIPVPVTATAAEIQQELDRVLWQPEKAREMGQKAQSRFVAGFTVGKMLSEYETLYESLI